MVKGVLKISFNLFLLGLCCFGKAQDRPINFKNFNVSSGLNSQNIEMVVQDTAGFIWIGTQEGLNRFDGHSIKSISVSNSKVFDERILYLYIDHQSTLWIGKGKGLTKYDCGEDNFITYINDPKDSTTLVNNYVGAIYEDSHGNFWVGCWDGLCKMDRETGKFTFYEPPEHITANGNKCITAICEDNNGILWLGTMGGGLFWFDEERGFYKHFQYDANNINTIGGNRIWNIYCDSKGTVWVACWRGGLNKYNTQFQNFTNIVFLNSSKGAQVTDMLEDSNGNFWVTCNAGLVKLNRENLQYEVYENHVSDQHSLASPVVSSIFEDNDKGIWVGSPYHGLFYFNLRQLDLEHYNRMYGHSDKYDIRLLNGVYELNNGRLYLYSRIDNNQFFDRAQRKFIFTDNKTVFYQSADKRLWVLDENRIKVTKPGDLSQIEKIIPINEEVSERTIEINNIQEDAKEGIWVMLPQKLLYLDSKKGEATFYSMKQLFGEHDIKNNSLTSICVDKKNVIWLLNSANQICKFHPTEGRCEIVNEISYNESVLIYKIFEDSKDRMWFATAEGLFVLDENSNSLQNAFTMLDNRFSVIYSIDEDKEGNLWLVTRGGLVNFNPDSKRFIQLTNENGLNGREIRANILFTDDNELIFGNAGALIVMNLEQIAPSKAPNVYFTEFKIKNTRVIPNENNVLKSTILNTDAITLDYKQASMFSFEFTALSFLNSDRVVYKYKLAGYDNEWHEIGNNNQVSFTNLSHGKYKLIVKAMNSDNVWSQEKIMSITILPPYWKTLWFRGLIILFLIAMITTVWRIRIRNMKLRQKELEIIVQQRTAEVMAQKEEIEAQSNNLKEAYQIVTEHKEELALKAEELSVANVELEKLNATKDKFFNIIAHDLKNPFQSISGFSDILIRDREKLGEEESLGFLKIIKSSSNLATSLLENLLKWAQAQTNRIKHTPEAFDLQLVAENTIQLLQVNSQAKNISLVNQIPANTMVYADKNMIMTIIRNLSSNAIKFSNIGGMVKLSSITNDKGVIICVEDNGMGMPENIRDNLFKIEKVVSKTGTSGESGTGLGLIVCKEFADRNNAKLWVESEPGKGSHFYIQIPENRTGVEMIRKELKEKEAETEIKKQKEKEELAEIEKGLMQKTKLSPNVMVVEDNKEIRLNIISILDMYYNTMEFANGKEGVDAALENVPDLIVCDWMMPEMNGIELCQALKNDQRTSHIPIVMLTARNEANDILQGLETGADDYITKPFDSRILLARVNNLIVSRKKLHDSFIKKMIIGSSTMDGLSVIDKKFLEKAIAVVEKHIDNIEFDVSGFAEEIGLSRSQVHNKLKALTNQSTSEFIRTIRLRHAAQILVKKDININEVFLLVGFNERTYFSKTFHELFGLSPKEYQQKYAG